MPDYKARLAIHFRLPTSGLPRVSFETDYLFDGGRLVADGVCILHAASRAALEQGVSAIFAEGVLSVRLEHREGEPKVLVSLDDAAAIDERDVDVRATRSVLVHALLALAGSSAGFVASALYLHKASLLHSAWALKMGQHTAGWHLLLTLTLLPGSIWGGRTGIRVVQVVCLVFFGIHVVIALANVVGNDPGNPNDPSIALFNGLSGALFLVAALYGNRAHREMDPGLALLRAAGRTACADAQVLRRTSDQARRRRT